MTGDGLGPGDALEAVRRTIEESGEMPDGLSYLEREPGDNDNDVKLPVLILQPLSEVRIANFNTDQSGWVTDTTEDGETVRAGRVFTAEYRFDAQLDIWIASGSSYDERELGEKMYQALYRHDSHGPAEPLLDENGNPIESVWRFRVEDGEQANDLTGTPNLRRWRQDISLWGYHRFDTSEDYITDVNYPDDSDTSGSDIDDGEADDGGTIDVLE